MSNSTAFIIATVILVSVRVVVVFMGMCFNDAVHTTVQLQKKNFFFQRTAFGNTLKSVATTTVKLSDTVTKQTQLGNDISALPKHNTYTRSYFGEVFFL